MSTRDFARRHIFHNLGLKIISLGIATALWLAVSNEPVSEAAFNVAIVFKNMPDELEISSELIPSAQIRVRGPERLVRRLEASDVHEEIDLTGMKPGERTFDLNKNQVNLPDKLEVSQIVPSQIHLAFDNRTSRVVPVRPRVIGTFASGYSIGQIKTDPATVEIVGPKKIIDDVESAITDPIDASGLIDRTTYFRHAYVSDPLIQVVDPRPVRVTVIMERTSTTSGPPQSQ
ncbi:MAG TPA: CdaR family protein [Terriglobales bacterium]|jgi:YbbR domain-containing protein|nr:CdaR family protein [Terriglobales bacterium]